MNPNSTLCTLCTTGKIKNFRPATSATPKQTFGTPPTRHPKLSQSFATLFTLPSFFKLSPRRTFAPRKNLRLRMPQNFELFVSSKLTIPEITASTAHVRKDARPCPTKTTRPASAHHGGRRLRRGHHYFSGRMPSLTQCDDINLVFVARRIERLQRV